MFVAKLLTEIVVSRRDQRAKALAALAAWFSLGAFCASTITYYAASDIVSPALVGGIIAIVVGFKFS